MNKYSQVYPNEQPTVNNSAIDELLYQNVVSRLNCSTQQENQSIVPALAQNDPDNKFTGLLENYNTSSFYDPSSTWAFWLILILVVVLIYLLYKYSSSSVLSAETIRATILGYQP
jgi:hypothetical protein